MKVLNATQITIVAPDGKIIFLKYQENYHETYK